MSLWQFLTQYLQDKVNHKDVHVQIILFVQRRHWLPISLFMTSKILLQWLQESGLIKLYLFTIFWTSSSTLIDLKIALADCRDMLCRKPIPAISCSFLILLSALIAFILFSFNRASRMCCTPKSSFVSLLVTTKEALNFSIALVMSFADLGDPCPQGREESWVTWVVMVQ